MRNIIIGLSIQTFCQLEINQLNFEHQRMLRLLYCLCVQTKSACGYQLEWEIRRTEQGTASIHEFYVNSQDKPALMEPQFVCPKNQQILMFMDEKVEWSNF